MRKISIYSFTLSFFTHLCFPAAEEQQLTIWQAAAKGKTAQVSQLLTLKTYDINQREDNTGKTALMYATKAPHTNTLEYILQNGGDVSITCVKNRNALEYAIRRENLPAVRALLESKSYAVATAHAAQELKRGNVGKAVSGLWRTSKKRLPWYGESQQTPQKYKLAVKLRSKDPTSEKKKQIVQTFAIALTAEQRALIEYSAAKHHQKRHPIVNNKTFIEFLGNSESDSDNVVLSDDEQKRE